MKALSATLTLTALLAGQPANQPIDGSWTATFEGRTFIRLEIKTVNAALGGGISLGNIELDPQGVVRRVEVARPNLTPIFDVKRTAASVTFSIREGGGTDHFELRLLEKGDAELHFVLSDEDRKELKTEGVPLPKPIRLTKTR